MFLCEVQRIQHGYVEPLLVMQLKAPEDFRYPSTREAADRQIRTYMTNLSGRVSKPSRILYLTNSTQSCLSTACSTRHQRNGDSTHFLHKGPRRGYRPSGTSRRWYHEDDMKTGSKSLLLLIASAWSQSHRWVCDLQWNRKRYEIQRSSKDCVINYLWHAHERAQQSRPSLRFTSLVVPLRYTSLERTLKTKSRWASWTEQILYFIKPYHTRRSGA